MAISFGDVLNMWDKLGFFDYILPFLLVFAVIYGILGHMKMFSDNKGLNVIIALALGLMSLRLGFLAEFLKELSPRLAVGLMILLALLIMIGLFVPDTSQAILGWILMGVGIIVFIVILAQTSTTFAGFGGVDFGGDLIAYVLLIAFLIGIIVAVVTGSQSGSGGGKHSTKMGSLYER